MEIIGGALVLIGVIIHLIYGFILLIKAFKESLLWGFGCLLLPIVSLVFIIAYWDKAKGPFLKSLTGVVLAIFGVILANMGS